MKTTTFEELKEKSHGKIGTPERNALEKRLRRKRNFFNFRYSLMRVFFRTKDVVYLYTKQLKYGYNRQSGKQDQ